MALQRPRDRGSFEIALICALQIEADAVHAVFDKFWEDEGERYGQAPGDDNAYTTGLIGGHNIVLAYMPGMGKVSASAVSVGLRTSFPSIKLALVVGICGGVPYDQKKRTRIYLGDLIVSTALVQYDFGRLHPHGYETKHTLEDTLGRASPRIRAFLNKLETKHYRRNLQKTMTTILDVMMQEDPDMRCPGPDKDLLFNPEYLHQHHSSTAKDSCNDCHQVSGLICGTASQLTCYDLGCDVNMLDLSHTDTIPRQRCVPVIHFGRLGSGDTVIRSGKHRDDLAQRDGVIGLEMEGAGVWDQLPSIIIKSVCDYADSHKNKDWQGYSAAVAAAGVKAFLMEWSPSNHLLSSSRPRSENGLSIHSDANEQSRLSLDHESELSMSARGFQPLPSGKRRKVDDYVPISDTRYDDAILASLSFQGMSERRNNIETQHRKTCKWIFNLAQYQKWQSQHSGLLWIKGKPGAGKSTIMLFLYNTLYRERKLDHGLHLDFFFSARGNELERIPLGMLRSLLNQLFSQDIGVRDVVRKSYLEKKTTFGGADGNWTWQRRELEALVLETVKLSTQRHQVSIFIDALDEAGEQAAREVAQYFHDMNEQISELSGSVKIIISCRHYPIVTRVMGTEICVEDHNYDDIKAYVYDRLHIQGTTSNNAPTVDTWPSLADELVEQAHGVFQWVSLVLPIIEKSFDDGQSLKLCRQKLQTVPEGLENVYRYILLHVINKEHRHRSFRLFQWVCLAERPLTVTEMRFAIATKDMTVSSARVKCCDTAEFIENDELMERQIRALSGGLIEAIPIRWVIDGPKEVQVIHQSVNDFFLSQGLALLWDHWNSSLTSNSSPSTSASTLDVISLCQEDIYRCCLNYLGIEDCNFVSQNIRGSLISNSSHIQQLRMYAIFNMHIQPLEIYALFDIFKHARKSVVGRRLWSTDDEAKLIRRVLGRWSVIDDSWSFSDNFLHTDPHNAKLYISKSILHLCASANLSNVVKYLVHTDVAVDAQDEWGNTALHVAAYYDHFSVAELLVNAGCNVNVKTAEGQTSMELAAANGNLQLVELLYTYGASTEAPTSKSGGPLHAAVWYGRLSVVRYLIAVGANIGAQRDIWGSLLEVASSRGNIEMIQIFLKAGLDVNAQSESVNCTALIAACDSSNEDAVQTLIQAGADVNCPVKDHDSPLQVASRQGCEKIVRMLLDAGADVNAQGPNYPTALQSACYEGHTDVVRTLLDAGTDFKINHAKFEVFTFDHYDKFESPLHAASYEGYTEIARMLLKATTDLLAHRDYSIALLGATQNGHDDLVGLLVESAGAADINLQEDCHAALPDAIEEGHTEVVRILLAAQVDVKEADERLYERALYIAWNFRHKQIVLMLLALGADPSIKIEVTNDDGTQWESALDAATETDDKEMVQLFLDARSLQ